MLYHINGVIYADAPQLFQHVNMANYFNSISYHLQCLQLLSERQQLEETRAILQEHLDEARLACTRLELEIAHLRRLIRHIIEEVDSEEE
ncbi:hypothetical protein QR680_006960 [Steinernema hermaphroditum]|uniref:Uncharacterized protein n=1 Tax=Steinernema hermaphroditum TaxID=289476 RepID=A0AA39HZH7_9BILA|nr:hypothetical protein QR680_006960 [Steinernema hermaphroditum]